MAGFAKQFGAKQSARCHGDTVSKGNFTGLEKAALTFLECQNLTAEAPMATTVAAARTGGMGMRRAIRATGKNMPEISFRER